MSYFDKAMNLWLGAISLTKEKTEAFIDELVERGEMSKEEAKQTMEEVMQKGEEFKTEYRNMVREEIDEWRSKFGVISKSEYDKLAERVKELEAKLAKEQE